MLNKIHNGLFSSFTESKTELKTKNRTVSGIKQVAELLTQSELNN